MTKLSGKVPVYYTLDDLASSAFDRRIFIKGVGFAVSAVPRLPLIAHASANSSNEGIETADIAASAIALLFPRR